MGKYLIQAAYTTDRGRQGRPGEGGPSRREAVENTVTSVGGELECFYFGLGEDDAHVIVDLPDRAADAEGDGRSGQAVGRLHRPGVLTDALGGRL
jgi:uncharacterized protein with GYD domain